MTAKSLITGKKMKPYGKSPSIVNPKYAHNVGVAVRAASAYGVPQVWFTGNRVQMDIDSGKRLPREERMKGYKDDRPFDQFPAGTIPVVKKRIMALALQLNYLQKIKQSMKLTDFYTFYPLNL